MKQTTNPIKVPNIPYKHRHRHDDKPKLMARYMFRMYVGYFERMKKLLKRVRGKSMVEGVTIMLGVLINL